MEFSLQEIMATAGGVSVVISGVTAFIAKLISDNQNEKWRSKTEVGLKKLESNLQQSNSNVNNLLEVQKSNYSISQERRILYVESAWEATIKFKKALPSSITFIYNMLTENEIQEFLQTADSNWHLKVLKDELQNHDRSIFHLADSELSDLLAFKRPFLGERLYYLLETYKSFIGRIYYLITDGLSKGSLYHWKNDRAIIKILKDVLSEDDMLYLLALKTLSYNYAQEFLQNKIMHEINALLNGNIAAENSQAHLTKLQNLFSLQES